MKFTSHYLTTVENKPKEGEGKGPAQKGYCEIFTSSAPTLGD